MGRLSEVRRNLDDTSMFYGPYNNNISGDVTEEESNGGCRHFCGLLI
jgi:hypothetical protein